MFRILDVSTVNSDSSSQFIVIVVTSNVDQCDHPTPYKIKSLPIYISMKHCQYITGSNTVK
jgi:hypothetical protein